MLQKSLNNFIIIIKRYVSFSLLTGITIILPFLVKNQTRMPDKIADIEKPDQTIKIYKKRWFMLLLFCIFGISNTLQYIQYSIVADVVVEYYNVSYTAVDWSSIIFAVTYIVFSFPGVYVLDKLVRYFSLTLNY